MCGSGHPHRQPHTEDPQLAWSPVVRPAAICKIPSWTEKVKFSVSHTVRGQMFCYQLLIDFATSQLKISLPTYIEQRSNEPLRRHHSSEVLERDHFVEVLLPLQADNVNIACSSSASCPLLLPVGSRWGRKTVV